MTDQQPDAAPAPPEPTLPELTARAAVLAKVATRFAKMAKDAKAESDKAMLDRWNTEGSKTNLTKIDGKSVVTWSVNEPQAKIVVDDVDAFNAHIEEHHPSEASWEYVMVIQPAFANALAKRAVWDEATETVIDPATGLPIAGMKQIPAAEAKTVSPTWQKDADKIVMEFLRQPSGLELLAAAVDLPTGSQGEEGQA